jgi:hypothetical protein
MMRRIVPGLFLSLMACGGRFDPTQVQAKLVGSYELTFRDVAAVDDGTNRPRPYGGGSPGISNGKRARLDIADDGAGHLRAAMTGEWGNTGLFDVALSDGKAVLTGSATVSGSSNGGSTTDRWTRLEITIGADGTPAGDVVVGGDEEVTSGDVGWGYAIGGKAALAKDDVAPETKETASSAISPDALLPWEPVLLMSSEPLDAKAWKDSVSASSSVTWTVDSELWNGTTLLRGVRPTWEGGASVRVNVGANRDRSGNASAARSFDAAFLDLGAPRAAFDFFAAAVASWGKVAPATGATCESGGCLDIGPARLGYCNAERAGFAGRLATSGKKSMVVRYRAEYTASPNWGAQQPTGQPLLSLELATPGHAAEEKSVPPLTMSQAGEKVWRSDWSTARFDLPQGAQEVGFVLRTGGQFGSCNFGPYPGDMGSSRIVVQSVTAE